MTGQYGQDPRYGAPPGPDRRSSGDLGWAVAGILLIVVVVLTGALLVLLLGRSEGGTTASDSPGPSSPSATAPSGQESTPDPAPTSGRSRAPASTATIGPAPTAAIPLVRLTLVAIGLEDPASPDALDRVIAFTSEGGQRLRVEATAVSVGEVELCLEPVSTGNGGCETGADAVLEGGNDAGPTDWRVVLRGATDGVAATVDLQIRLPVTAANVQLGDFRLSGVSGGANGLTAEFRGRAGGPLGFEATWPTPTDWMLTVANQDDPAAPFEASGDASSTSASASTDLSAGGRFRLDFISPTGAEEVHFDATLTLP